MVIRLTTNCVLGKAGQLVNLPVGRGYDLIKAGLGYEYFSEMDKERKVMDPEIKEQPRKRGRPRKTPCTTD